jgi:superfamily II DNA or RNA helicase
MEEAPSGMRLIFDQGTLVLAEAPDRSFEFVPGLVWDPRIALWRAPAWRYPEVLAALRERGMPVLDEVWARPVADPATFRPPALRPYQRAAALQWELAGRRGLLVLPTGSGKTRVALALLAATRAPALCLVPTRALLAQWISELGHVYSGEIGCLGDGQQRIERITVSTFESAYRLMPRIGKSFEFLIVDEVHHFGANVRDEALEMCMAPMRLGMTATPPAEPALTRLGQLIGPVVYQLGVADLAGKYLADFELVVVRLGLDRSERAAYAAEQRVFGNVRRAFQRLHPEGSWQDFVSAASQSAEGRAALAAWRRARKLIGYTSAKAAALRLLLARHRQEKLIVFTADNAAAYAIAREQLIMPITCDISRRERERALDAFRRGELRALVSARVLNEGIDVPDAEVAVIVAGTLGQREHVQRIGRLLRPAPEKRAVVYELVTMATSEAWQAAQRRQGLVATHVMPA